MKIFSVIKKNFKLLVRSKASAFTVLIGPLLIILLVGLAFSGKSSYELSIGYSAPEKNNLTDAFINSLVQSNYFVQEFPDSQNCIKKIEQGIIHTCILFPQNFQVSNEKGGELRFLVDYSRMNLVYKVIDSVSEILEIQSKEVSYSLTQTLLSRINVTINNLNSDLVGLSNAELSLNLIATELQKAKVSSASMNFDIKEVDASQLLDQVAVINQSFDSMMFKGSVLINKSSEWIDDLSGYENVSSIEEEFSEIKDDLVKLYNSTPSQIQTLIDKVNATVMVLAQLEANLEQNRQLNQDVQSKVDGAKTNLAAVQSELLDLKNSLIATKQNLESISITRAETIVSPVNIQIEPVVSETSKLTFTFPFLLMLVIMFVALLLSSTLIMFEKNSKSFFRNHITPTKQEFFVITTFITSFIVLVIQTLIILGLANYFMHIPLFKNTAFTALIIILASAFFIALGMTAGYVFSTQEGAIMASIVLGSIFLFLSNLVVPLESLAPALTDFIKYNPYVLASELLRKSLLFKVSLLNEGLIPLIILGGATFIIFLLILIFTSFSEKKRIKTPVKETIVDRKRGPQEESSQLASVLIIGEQRATNKKELFKLVSDMTKTEFEDNVNQYENKIAAWAEKELKDKKLASKLRKTGSRKDMLKILSEELKVLHHQKENVAEDNSEQHE